MKKIPSLLLTIFLFSLLTAALPAQANQPSEDIEIQVSPHTILLSWKAKGDVRVTVHAEIDFSSVATYSVALGGFEAISTYADARGDLVAKFNYAEVAELVGAGDTTLFLTGTRMDGTSFFGSDDVRVVR